MFSPLSESSPTLIQSMTVDVRLCGSIPRQDMKEQFMASVNKGAPCCLSLSTLTSRVDGLSASHLAAVGGSKSETPTHHTIAVCEGMDGLLSQSSVTKTRTAPLDDSSTRRGVPVERQPVLTNMLAPPSWAVPARGETRLEPVCESIGRQADVDLTKKECFRIGRSPNSDVQLMHATSSRRHAMLFHHANGSCYVVDCGSAHGTFVNGSRIASPANGVVVPHRVRRGAMIRFGGPGAPCFVLKSFSFSLSDITMRAPSNPDIGELVRRNTRINALGRTASLCITDNICSNITMALSVSRKRSFDSLDSRETLDEEEPYCKRLRFDSPPLSPEVPIRLVSPDLQAITLSKPRRVRFSAEPPQTFYPSIVTPDVLSGEEDNDEA